MELAQAKANSQLNQQKTMANTPAKTAMQSNGGMMQSDVPVEFDHYLTASPDANGHMRVRDTDASGPSTVSAVEVPDEI